MVSQMLQHGLRASACVLVVAVVQATLYELTPACRKGKPWCDDVQKGLQWSAITTQVVMSLADVGSAAEKGANRALGTVFGGLCGLAAAVLVQLASRTAALYFVLLASAGTCLLTIWGDATGRACPWAPRGSRTEPSRRHRGVVASTPRSDGVDAAE